MGGISRTVVAVGVAALGTLGVTACDSDSTKTTATTTSGGSVAGFGRAAEATAATRTVEVHILATRRYEPSSLNVTPGQTVTFKVVNDDPKVIHEFVLGDDKAQDDYEKLMEGMGTTPMKMNDKANLVNIDPGQTEELTWTFPSTKGATVIFGSHEPGDYAAGLKGTITVE
jgi:uncharacterized cupredoxin-like copper-binding protein